MDLSSTLARSLYSHRPSSTEEKKKIISFLELENECDKENIIEFNKMDQSHLLKKHLKEFNQSVSGKDGWIKTNARIKKLVLSAEVHTLNEPRTWYH